MGGGILRVGAGAVVEPTHQTTIWQLQVSEALDFNDIRRYVFAVKLYNLGIVLILWGMGMLVFLFDYLIPTFILFAFSIYWIREIVRTTRTAKTSPMKFHRVKRLLKQISESSES